VGSLKRRYRRRALDVHRDPAALFTRFGAFNVRRLASIVFVQIVVVESERPAVAVHEVTVFVTRFAGILDDGVASFSLFVLAGG
jgi:hypothetical protein